MTDAIVIGQSHAVAIADAIELQGSGTMNVAVYRIGAVGENARGAVLTNPEALALAASLPASTPLFISMLGTYHSILGLLRAGTDFDFLLDALDVPEAGPVSRVPHRAMAGAFETHFEEAKAFKRLAEAARSPVYILSAPPPKRSSEFILDRFLKQKKQVYRGRSVGDVGIERPISRLKLWKLEARLMQRWAAAQGIQFVPPPPGACDTDGFLGREFYFDDVTHANARYGKLIVQQISTIVEELRVTSDHG
jgi:hypothetical protein